MSDFTSGFWNVWVIAITLGGIAFCGWILLGQSKSKTLPEAGEAVESTGHVWDEDLRELNNPLPKWWSNLFWITIVFSLVYLALYPGLGTTKGVLGWTSVGQYEKERREVDARVKPLYDKFLEMELSAVAADPEARGMGERIFLNNCAIQRIRQVRELGNPLAFLLFELRFMCRSCRNGSLAGSM